MKLSHHLFIFVLTMIGLNTWAIWQPKQGLKQVNIWPGPPPGGDSTKGENEGLELSSDNVGGRPYQWVSNVSTPTYTIFPAKGKNTGVAIVVFPGGGHIGLAIDIEGTEVCDWLTSHGITCALVKYRVPYSGCYYDKKQYKNITPEVPMALQDAQRVISTVRHNAKKYKINPKKIGVMGFSAGGNVTVLSSTRFKKRAYKAIDEIDKISSRPDFSIPVFPGHMTMEHKNLKPRKVAKNKLNTDIPISSEIPPTMLVHAEDDKVNPSYYSKLYAKKLRNAGIKTKLYLYKTGGHAFGARIQGKHSDKWMNDTITWLKDIKIIEI